jgi:hypothetical protein
MKKNFIQLSLVSSLLLVGMTFCNQQESSKVTNTDYSPGYSSGTLDEKSAYAYEESYYDMPTAEAEAYDAAVFSKSTTVQQQNSTDNNLSLSAVQVETQKLIKTGNLGFKTDNIKDARQKINQIINTTQSYVSNESEDHYNGTTTQYITVRIPSEHFEHFLNQLNQGVDNFDYKNIYVTDVTDQYTDIQARIATKKAIEQKYIALLDKAKTIAEILEIERQIGYLRGDIEAAEARFKTMSQQIVYSTLDIKLYEVDASHPQSEEPTLLTELGVAFKAGWKAVLDFMIGLVYNWPVILIFCTIILIVRKKWRIWLSKIKAKLKPELKP